MKLLWSIFLLFVVLHQGACDGVCTAPGRFPNNTRSDCRGYVMCLKGATTITHYDLVCPEQFVYSHIDNQCTNVTSYQCLLDYSCPEEGIFVNHLSDDCDSYITCIKDLNNVISARIIKCPENMIFNAMESICVDSTLHKCIPEPPKDYDVSVNVFTEVKGSFPSNAGTYIIYNTSSFVLFLSFILQFFK